MKSLCCVCISIVLGSVPGIALLAQETVLHVFLSTSAHPQMENVLYYAAGIELTQAGLSSSRTQHVAATYDLVTEYTIENETLRIDYTLYRFGDRADPLAAVRLDTVIDIELDRRIGRAVSDLIDDAGIKRLAVAEANIEGVTPVDRDEAPRDPPPGRPAVLVDDDPLPVSAEGQPIVSGPEFSVSAGIMLFTGEAQGFFTHGIQARASAGFAISHAILSITAGGSVSTSRVVPGQGVSGADLYITTIGPELLVGSRLRRPNRVDLRIAGGAALITVNGPGGAMTKTVPYVEGGVRTRLPLGEHFAIGIGIDCMMVFEESVLIIGLIPGLVFSWEL